jgi:AAA domain
MASAFERRLAELARKPRILVCAPSNAAADELLQRVMDDGFADGGGHVYRPSVVRIGAPPAWVNDFAAAAGSWRWLWPGVGMRALDQMGLVTLDCLNCAFYHNRAWVIFVPGTRVESRALHNCPTTGPSRCHVLSSPSLM